MKLQDEMVEEDDMNQVIKNLMREDVKPSNSSQIDQEITSSYKTLSSSNSREADDYSKVQVKIDAYEKDANNKEFFQNEKGLIPVMHVRRKDALITHLQKIKDNDVYIKKLLKIGYMKFRDAYMTTKDIEIRTEASKIMQETHNSYLESMNKIFEAQEKFLTKVIDNSEVRTQRLVDDLLRGVISDFKKVVLDLKDLLITNGLKVPNLSQVKEEIPQVQNLMPIEGLSPIPETSVIPKVIVEEGDDFDEKENFNQGEIPSTNKGEFEEDDLPTFKKEMLEDESKTFS